MLWHLQCSSMPAHRAEAAALTTGRTMSDQYQGLYHSFQWLIPSHFNIAQACCHQWASNPSDARRVVLHSEDADGHLETWTYGRLGTAVKQLANGLRRMGLGQGERVAVLLGQRAETLIAHMAAYSIGAIVVPLSTQSAPPALVAQLRDAEARTAIVDASCDGQVMAALERVASLQQIISIDFHNDYTIPWRSLIARQSADFHPTPTRASDPALLFYTADTSGSPQGVLLSHAALIGNLPGFVAAHDWIPRPGDVFWTSMDWSSNVGLMGGLLPTLYFGLPIVAMPAQAPEQVLTSLARHAVRCILFSSSALDALRQHGIGAIEPRLALRSIAVTGACLDPDLFDWCRAVLGVTPNASYGLTEAHHIIGQSQAKWPSKPGSMGRPIPGHNIAILDAQGQPLSVGDAGEIALGRFDIHGAPDPALCLGYWRNDDAMQARCVGNWFRTGDRAWRDENGDFWRAEPMVKTSASY